MLRFLLDFFPLYTDGVLSVVPYPFSYKPRGVTAHCYLVKQLLGMQTSPYTRIDCIYSSLGSTLHLQL